MAETKREIERKYEATPGTRLPDLTRAPGVSAVLERGVTELDAVYYDTAGLRLAADSSPCAAAPAAATRAGT